MKGESLEMAARKLKPAEPEKPQNDQPAGDTSWKNGVPEAGWYKMPDAWWRDLPRLQRGLYQRMLIEYVWGTTVPRSKGAAMPEKSPWLSYVEMAAVFRCSPEQVRDDARDAAKRGLLIVEEPGSRGKVRFQVCWERWPNLKDYVAPAPKILKKERVAPSSRWLAGVSVRPGGSYDFTVPELPADFRLQKISLRNTGESGELVFSGGGPAEGGIIVLEAQSSAEIGSIKSASSDVQREHTPGNMDEQRKSVPRAGGAVSRGENQNPERRNSGGVDGSPQPAARAGGNSRSSDPVVQQIAEAIGTYGPITIEAVTRLIAASHATPERVLESLSVVRLAIPEDSPRPVGWLLTMIPQNIAGTFNPAQPKKKVSEREKRIADAFRLSREIKEGKIA